MLRCPKLTVQLIILRTMMSGNLVMVLNQTQALMEYGKYYVITVIIMCRVIIDSKYELGTESIIRISNNTIKINELNVFK